MRIFLWLLLVAIFVSGAPGALAQSSQVGVELNKLEPIEGACRAYLVLQNGTDTDFGSLKLDLVMFDSDGIVAKRIAVETAPLPAGKTSLKVFDIDGLSCDHVGRVLLNDVMTCAGASGAVDDCLGLLSTSGRGPLEFFK